MSIFFPTREVALTNERGDEVGVLDIYQAHQYPGQLHKAPSVWLMNSKGEVLLQKRSQQKPIGAGWWGNGICGNVLPGESYEACAHRRLSQELGIIDVKLSFVYSFIYKAFGNETYGEYERDEVYVAVYDGELRPNINEVEAVVWVDKKELAAQVENISYIEPEKTLSLTKEELKRLTPPVTLTLQQRELVITPWTFMMLKDSRLQQLLFA